MSPISGIKTDMDFRSFFQTCPYGKFTHDFTYEIFICEIVMWNWNNSYMKISYVKSISHMKVSHMKFSYVKSLCGIGTIHIWNFHIWKFHIWNFHMWNRYVELEPFIYENFTYEIFICEISFTYERSQLHMTISHMKFSYVKIFSYTRFSYVKITLKIWNPKLLFMSIICNRQIVFTISNTHNRQKLYIFENCTCTITYTLNTICNCLSAS